MRKVSHSPSAPSPVFCGQCCFLLPILFEFTDKPEGVASLAVDTILAETGGGDTEDESVTVIVGGGVANLIASAEAHHFSRLLPAACYKRRPITANICLVVRPFPSLRHYRPHAAAVVRAARGIIAAQHVSAERLLQKGGKQEARAKRVSEPAVSALIVQSSALHSCLAAASQAHTHPPARSRSLFLLPTHPHADLSCVSVLCMSARRACAVSSPRQFALPGRGRRSGSSSRSSRTAFERARPGSNLSLPFPNRRRSDGMD